MRLLSLWVVVVFCGCGGLIGSMPEGPDASLEEVPDAGVDASTSVPDAAIDQPDAGEPDAGAIDAGSPDAGRTVFVIGGQDMRHMISFDGVTWEHDTYVAPNGEDNAFGAIAIGAGGIVLAGDPGIYRSTDGIDWQLVQLRPSRFAFHASVAAFADGRFVILAQDKAWRSFDGVTWQSQQDTAGSAGHWHALVFGNGTWVGVGDGKRKRSVDGLTWTDVTPVTAGQFNAVAYGNGIFVAVGKTGNAGWVATSTDGQSWVEQATIPTQYDTGLSTVVFGAGRFLTSTCCATLESSDGVTWSPRTANGSGGGMVFAGGRFVSSGWRTNASVLLPDAGRFMGTLSGDHPNLYDDAGIAPWFTGLGAGQL